VPAGGRLVQNSAHASISPRRLRRVGCLVPPERRHRARTASPRDPAALPALCSGQMALRRDALVGFGLVSDAVFEVAAIVRKPLRDFVVAAGRPCAGAGRRWPTT
jgi:hypothetical protein